VTEPPNAGGEFGPGNEGAQDPALPEQDRLSRLDPERAGTAPHTAAGHREPGRGEHPPVNPDAERAAGTSRAAVVDTRRYRWMIGIFGLCVVVAISIYGFATHGVGTTGVPPGHRLRYFAAPLANTNLVGDPNLNPPCTPARHDPRALNLCLDARRAPLVLALFVTGSDQCVHSVDALQSLSRSRSFGRRAVQFAAVAVQASRSDTAALVRGHHWTIPVAYDRDGSLRSLYGVAVCPMLELAGRGGIVKARLVGDQWQTAEALAPKVRALVRAHGRRS
jgi:hypothetical protein